MPTILAVKLASQLGEGGPPGWFQVFPAGQVLIEDDAPAIMDVAGAFSIIERFHAHDHDMVVDYEHQTVTGGKAPAAGWIKDLEWRENDGLWARVEWTEEAAGYITRREYRYISPVFLMQKADRRIVELLNVALTNQPRMMNVRALAAKYTPTTKRRENMLEKLKKLFGLAETAGEDEVVQAVEGLAAKNKELEKAGEVVACKEVLEVLGAKDDEDKEAVVAKAKALVAVKGSKDGIETELTALKKDHEDLKRKWDERDRDDHVNTALTAGKITPAQKEWAEEYALKDPEGFKAFVAKAPQVVPLEKLPGGGKDQPSGSAGEKVEQLVAKKMKDDKDLSYADAMNLVANENPDLAQEYLDAGRGQ